MALNYNGIPFNNEIRQVYSHGRSAIKRVKDSRNENLIQIPNWYFPHSGFTGSLWIEFQPMQLDQINTGGRGGSYVTNSIGPTYRFLSPIDGLMETHNYDWSEYESIQAKLLKMFTNIEIGVEQIKQIGGSALASAWNQIKSGELPTAQDIENGILKATAIDVPKRKIDSPLAFTGSARREFLLNFPLLSEGLKTNLVEVIKGLQEYAAPVSSNQGYIEWPHVWRVQSDPRGVLDIDIAAMTSVQATWLDPYIGGVPQRCELTLGFRDISPLFRDTIRYGSIVKVTSKVKDAETEHKSWAEHLKNKGTLMGDIRSATDFVREQLGYPKTNTPTNP